MDIPLPLSPYAKVEKSKVTKERKVGAAAGQDEEDPEADPCYVTWLIDQVIGPGPLRRMWTNQEGDDDEVVATILASPEWAALPWQREAP